MIQRISRTATITTRLEGQGSVSYLDQPSHIEAIRTMNKKLEETRRDYQVKDKQSQTSASYVILTA